MESELKLKAYAKIVDNLVSEQDDEFEHSVSTSNKN